MEIKFNPGIPGYATYEECVTICDIINKVKCSSVLEIGSFTGRLTWSLCQTFTNKQITALDIWDGYIDFLFTKENNRYFGTKNTPEFFTLLQHAHPNLNIVQDNFYNYKTTHDVIVLGADGGEIVWEDLIDHALSLHPKLIIGRHAHNHRTNIKKVLELYDLHGVYVVKHKKDIINE
jgi:hypothetical protein